MCSPFLDTVSVFDSGLDGGARNAAADRAALNALARGAGGNRMRFYRSLPTASLGCHQAPEREVRIDYCASNGIEVIRRSTSGGALYVDAQQIGVSLAARLPAHWRNATLGGLLHVGSSAIADALVSFGIAAATKAPNDVEVEGRKIAAVFATRRGGVFLLQASVLVDADIETMLKVLRTPTEKLSPDGMATARDRITTLNACQRERLPLGAIYSALRDCICRSFGLQWRDALHTTADGSNGLLEAAGDDDPGSMPWDGCGAPQIEALIRTPGGTLRAGVNRDASDASLNGVKLACDAHLDPPGFFVKLGNALEKESVAQLGARIAEVARRERLDAVGVECADIERLLLQLAEKRRFARECGLNAAQANALLPFSRDAAFDSVRVLRQATAMLLPYCAKPSWCDWRHRDGCSECGLCEVGTAYELARERNMEVVTVTSYEHLVSTLASLKARQVQAYVGVCCSNFFIKRYRAFAEAGMPALLMDLSGANCYELQQEAQAYAGTFEAEARLDAELLAQVMKFVPHRAKPAQ